MKENGIIKQLLFTYHRIEVKTRPFLARIRRRRLNNTDFSIISNNCWGGICYEFYGLKKLSPTVGMYLYADDYIKFISNLAYYVYRDMVMITAEESKHYKSLKKKNETNIPIGRLDDIEVIFLHYQDPILAKKKWTKRVKRINWDNLIFKFSYMNECNNEHVERFLELTSKYKRICFVGQDVWKERGVYVVPASNNGQVTDDTTWFNKYLDVERIINSPCEVND